MWKKKISDNVLILNHYLFIYIMYLSLTYVVILLSYGYYILWIISQVAPTLLRFKAHISQTIMMINLISFLYARRLRAYYYYYYYYISCCFVCSSFFWKIQMLNQLTYTSSILWINSLKYYTLLFGLGE